MVGYIQYVLVGLVRELGGEDAVTAVCQKAGLTTAPSFRIDTDYSDSECLALIKATGEHFQLTNEQLYAAYADGFILAAKSQFPKFFAMASSAKDFLRRQPRIHQTLASSIRDADTRQQVGAKFELVEDGEQLVVRYHSKNGLCGLYEALFQRLLEEYGETGSMTHHRCQHRGHDYCEFFLQFDREAA